MTVAPLFFKHVKKEKFMIFCKQIAILTESILKHEKNIRYADDLKYHYNLLICGLEATQELEINN